MRGRLSEAKVQSMSRGIPRCGGCSAALTRSRIERGETHCAECAPRYQGRCEICGGRSRCSLCEAKGRS